MPGGAVILVLDVIGCGVVERSVVGGVGSVLAGKGRRSSLRELKNANTISGTSINLWLKVPMSGLRLENLPNLSEVARRFGLCDSQGWI